MKRACPLARMPRTQKICHQRLECCHFNPGFPPRGDQESQVAVSHSKWRGLRRRGVGPRHQGAGNALLTQPLILFYYPSLLNTVLAQLGPIWQNCPSECPSAVGRYKVDDGLGWLRTCLGASPATSPPHEVLAVTDCGPRWGGQAGREGRGRVAQTQNLKGADSIPPSTPSGPLDPRQRSQRLGQQGTQSWLLSNSNSRQSLDEYLTSS